MLPIARYLRGAAAYSWAGELPDSLVGSWRGDHRRCGRAPCEEAPSRREALSRVEARGDNAGDYLARCACLPLRRHVLLRDSLLARFIDAGRRDTRPGADQSDRVLASGRGSPYDSASGMAALARARGRRVTCGRDNHVPAHRPVDPSRHHSCVGCGHRRSCRWIRRLRVTPSSSCRMKRRDRGEISGISTPSNHAKAQQERLRLAAGRC